MKYAVLIMNTPLAATLSADEYSAWNGEIFAWYDKYTANGKLADPGNQLDDVSKAKTIRGTTVTDGPFIEAKEVVGGYSVLETDTIDEAVEIAKTWPGVDRGLITLEVRPIVEQPAM
jgi:hypothetical protein